MDAVQRGPQKTGDVHRVLEPILVTVSSIWSWRVPRYYEDCMDALGSHFLEEIRRQLRGYKRMAEGAIAQVTD